MSPDNFELFEGTNDRQLFAESMGIEKLMLRSERSDSLGKRILIRALGLVAYIPELTFDKEDVDMKVVQRLLRYPQHLKTIDDWILEPQQELVPKLFEAFKVLGPIQRKTSHSRIYRGFNPKSLDQDTMSLQKHGWWGPKPGDFKVGDKFSYIPERALSFTHHEATASVFGWVVISMDASKYRDRLFEIGPDICYAIMLADKEYDVNSYPYYVTYGELILLPNKRPIEFRVESINKKKS